VEKGNMWWAEESGRVRGREMLRKNGCICIRKKSKKSM
jgi:hypothetical protein